MGETPANLWRSQQHALEYLDRADSIPRRVEGEAALLEWLPRRLTRLLDVGSGDGRLLSIVKRARGPVEAVALDFSPAMLERLRHRFPTESTVRVVAHDLDEALPSDLGEFDAIVSSFAIHHVVHARKRALYGELFARLRPGGVLCNLEHVASPTRLLHDAFLAALGLEPDQEDPSNKLLDVETQLAWLREIGFIQVDCHWKWRELALLAGIRPARTGAPRRSTKGRAL